jgi:hypothetical protein
VRVVLADDAVLHAEVNSAAPGAALPAIGATVALNWEDSAPVAVREST